MKKCLLSEGSQSEGRHDVTLRLSKCVTNEGDSGGPMISQNGNIAGIVWGGGQYDTYGVNLACVPNPSDTVSKMKCAQSIEDAAFRLVQSLAFQEIFEVQKFGSRAPVSEDVAGGKLFVSGLSCFSKLPNEPVEIREPAVFINKQNLTQKILPLEAPSPFVPIPIILRLQAKNDYLVVLVLNGDHSPLFSYRPQRCP